MSCQVELRGLGSIIADLEKQIVRPVTVSGDPSDRRRPVVTRHVLHLTLLADEERILTRAFGLLHRAGAPDGSDIAIPAHLLIAPDHRVLWRNVSRRIQDRLPADRVLTAVRAALADASDS